MASENRKYVKMPIDLDEVKVPYAFNKTKREVFCFAIGIACGLPMFYFSIKIFGVSSIGITMSVVTFFLFAAPAIFIGTYRKNGIFLEQKIRRWFEFRKKTRKKLYVSRNVSEYVFLQKERSLLKRKLRQGGGE